MCELYCGGGLEAERWEEAQIGHYIGIGNRPCSVRSLFAGRLPCSGYVSLGGFEISKFCRCGFVWNKRKERSLGELEESLHYGLLRARPLHGELTSYAGFSRQLALWVDGGVSLCGREHCVITIIWVYPSIIILWWHVCVLSLILSGRYLFW